MEVRIPFAINANTGEYVTVDEMPSGEQCGCICPSCKAPLSAKKGEVNQHHFAHKPRTINPDEPCEITFERAFLWMCVSILKNADHLTLPALNYQWQGVDIAATAETAVRHVHKRSHWLGAEQNIDTEITVNDIPIKLELSLQNRLISVNPNADNAQVFVNLSELATEVQKARQGYLPLMSQWLLDSSKGKSWVSHPRLYRRVQTIKAEQSSRLSTEQRPKSVNAGSEIGHGVPAVRPKSQSEVSKVRKAEMSEDQRQEALRAKYWQQYGSYLNPEQSPEERAEAMVRIAQLIAEKSAVGRQCMKCNIMIPLKPYFRRCPCCGNLGFGDVPLTAGYLIRAKSQYTALGFADASLKLTRRR
jgi:hypothetical protein